MAKATVATTSLAGCFGCHMSLLDIDERILELFELVDFDKSPINDIKQFTGRCTVGLIEGGCANEENVRVLAQEWGANHVRWQINWTPMKEAEKWADDLDAFDADFVAPDRGTAYIAVYAETPEAKKAFDRIFDDLITDRHSG